MRRRNGIALALAALLPSCAVTPPPLPAQYAADALPGLQLPGQWSAEGGGEAEPVAAGWLAAFKDPRLTAFVAEATAHNPDLLVAAARVAVASEYVQLSVSTLYPQVNVLARGGGESGGDSSGLEGAGIFADWEVDLWGRLRSARAANDASYEATVAEAEQARQSVAALVAKSYFLAVEAALQQRLAEDMAAAADELVMLAGERQRVGRGNAFDVALARANAATFRDTVIGVSLAKEQALRALEALIGRYPAAAIDIADGVAEWPGPVPVGLPSELLERRPDVVAAERRVAAAFYRTEEARAARLPSIALTASYTDLSSDLFELKQRDNPVWSAGASLLAPLFNGGALRAQVRIRTAEQRQAIADYGRVGARAFGEVENALSAEIAAGRREQVLARAAAENQRALELARVRYDVGSSDLRDVQQQQVAVHGSRAALVRMQTERLVQRVNLYLALGGGFDEPAVKDRSSL
jgi:NodT family efflux transporter outer membrane factor (OMF) lipoprotein